ncbi:hypothetical protein MMC16_002948 [Acarospora aff. strigata]|nr:hypothetical protein [Acarospora aff. strigata]
MPRDNQTRISKQKDYAPILSHSVAVPRLILVLLISSTILLPSLWDPLLTTLWNYLLRSKFYNSSVFETIWTLFWYAVFEIVYNVKILQNPDLRLSVLSARARGEPRTTPEPPALRVPWKRLGELATYITPLLAMDLTMIKKFADVPLANVRESGGWGSIASDKAISASFLAPTLHNFSLTSPLQLIRALPVEGPSSRRLALELITSLLIYDALFFLFHLFLHRIPFLKRFHMTHHNHKEINPQITNQLDIVERIGLVLLANFSLNIIGSHVLTRTMFVPMFIYLLIEIHCGMDLPWGYEKILPWGIGAGSRKHATHHRTGNGLYEPFFCWWDRGLELFEGRRPTGLSRG